jgi:hypothetical protein
LVARPEGAGGPESGEVGWASWVGQLAKAREVGGPAGLEKKRKKEVHSKLISRFRKMNKEIRVTEIIGKNPKKFSENFRKFRKARM